MIETKIIVKPKGNSGTGNSSGASGYGGEYVSEAEYAARAGKAKKAESADLAMRANTASAADRAKYADKAGELDEEAEVLQRYIRKDIDDTAKGKITFEDVIYLLKGLQLGDGKSQITDEGLAKLYAFMTYNFVSGAYGSGASIDNNGDAEMNSLFVRQFISAPKFVFNEISVTKAEQWNTNGYGTIESVDTEKHIISLHLEGNDYGSLQVGDICRGIYADIDNAHDSDKNTEGALDDCNFVLHKGFFTTYFYVKKSSLARRVSSYSNMVNVRRRLRILVPIWILPNMVALLMTSARAACISLRGETAISRCWMVYATGRYIQRTAYVDTDGSEDWLSSEETDRISILQAMVSSYRIMYTSAATWSISVIFLGSMT